MRTYIDISDFDPDDQKEVCQSVEDAGGECHFEEIPPYVSYENDKDIEVLSVLSDWCIVHDEPEDVPDDDEEITAESLNELATMVFREDKLPLGTLVKHRDKVGFPGVWRVSRECGVAVGSDTYTSVEPTDNESRGIFSREANNQEKANGTWELVTTNLIPIQDPNQPTQSSTPQTPDDPWSDDTWKRGLDKWRKGESVSALLSEAHKFKVGDTVTMDPIRFPTAKGTWRVIKLGNSLHLEPLDAEAEHTLRHVWYVKGRDYAIIAPTDSLILKVGLPTGNPPPAAPQSPAAPVVDDPWSDDTWKSGVKKWLKGD